MCFPRFAISIISSREDVPTLTSCIKTTLRNITPANAVVDIVVNGNSALLSATSVWMQQQPPGHTRLRLWWLPLASKANAFNHYIQHIHPTDHIGVFIDGYVSVAPGSVAKLIGHVSDEERYLAASGIPIGERTTTRIQESTIIASRGLHGNLMAIRASVLSEMRQRGIRFPLGLYCVDGLMGAFCAYRLNPSKNAWDTKETLCTDAEVTWTIPPKHWWRISDIIAFCKRKGRQASSVVEQSAIRYFLAERRFLPENLPKGIDEAVRIWKTDRPDQFSKCLHSWNPLIQQSARALLSPKDWRLAEAPPNLILECSSS